MDKDLYIDLDVVNGSITEMLRLLDTPGEGLVEQYKTAENLTNTEVNTAWQSDNASKIYQQLGEFNNSITTIKNSIAKISENISKYGSNVQQADTAVRLNAGGVGGGTTTSANSASSNSRTNYTN